MKVAALLAELRRRDIQVWADGDRLKCDAPAGALTPELRARLRQRKSEVLEFLRAPAALSFSQERLWFLDQIEQASAAYVMALAFEMRGALDVTALERALATLVRRHESLRTVFAEVDGRPQQVVSDPAPWTLPVAQVSGEADARERLREEASRGFDLARGPLFRAHLYRLAAHAHVLLLAMHHSISDGWSLGILTRALLPGRARHAAGARAALPRLRALAAQLAPGRAAAGPALALALASRGGPSSARAAHRSAARVDDEPARRNLFLRAAR